MSSCLSSRACGFDLEHIVKWQSASSSRTASNSSSPSSTVSESSNSPITISNRKPRTPRKRPNQTYNEAAALFSMACPSIFSAKHFINKNSNPSKFTKQHGSFFNEPPELILPFPVIENSGFLLRRQIMEKPSSLMEPKLASSFRNTGEIESKLSSVELCDGFEDDFVTESMLDGEIEQGIDSIMGDSNSIIENYESDDNITSNFNTCYGYPMGFGFGTMNGVRALRNGDDRNWWSVPTIEMVNISPAAEARSEKATFGKMKKKRMEELMKTSESEFRQGDLNIGDEILSAGNGSRLLLKLDYDGILNAWSENGSPLPEEISLSESPGGDVHARASLVDLFSESKSRATRSMKKKNNISYQVKNGSLDGRPRSKGRFV